MEPLSTIIIAAAGKLAEKAFSEVSGELMGKTRRLVEGDPEKRAALQNCFAAGFAAALKEMRLPDNAPVARERLDRYEGVLLHWLALPEVVEELAKLVDVGAVLDDPTRTLDLPRLNALFKQAYPLDENPDAYVGLNFPAALRAFVRAYVAEVEKQADKFPWLKFHLLKEIAARLETRPRPETVRGMYLESLVRECDFLPLSVFRPQEGAPDTEATATLRQVYVPLDVLLQPPERERRGKTELRAFTPEELTEIGKEQRAPTLRALTETSRMVLLGDPGSGKTTLTNHLALCLAMDVLEPDGAWLTRLEGWTLGRIVPVRVTLREFAQTIPPKQTRGNAGLLWQFLESDLRQRGVPEFYAELRTELTERGGLLILDGLDEVPDTNGQRERVRESIAEFAGNVKHCRIVVTCRTYAYPSGPIPGFEANPLLPFSPKQIERFIDQWYAAIAPKEHLTDAEAVSRAAMLKDAVNAERNPYIADLAKRPLLLTLMAMVYASEGKLPEDRADLYERCVQLLLDTWQERKKIRDEQGHAKTELSLLEEIGIKPDALRAALNRVAYYAHERQGQNKQRELRTADIPSEELRRALALDSQKDFQAVLRYIHHRAGLIYWRGGDVYAFPHRSFQEYLAACHVSNLGDPQVEICKLVRADPEWWREVYLLQVGQLRKKLGTAIGLVNILCPVDWKPNANPAIADWQAAALAGQALVELRLPAEIETKRRHAEDVRPFETPLVRVRDWLKALLDTPVLTSRERAQAGLTLGTLDDRRNLDELCHVPAGEFVMGDKNGVQDEAKHEHNVFVPEFWIAKYPVTCAQYQRFIVADGYQKSEYWKSKAAREWLQKSKQATPRYWDDPRWNQPNLPVVGMTWFEANAYCEWLTERIANSELRIAESAAEAAIRNSKFVIRLPTEAEWEKAATWDAEQKKKRTWPWGDDFDSAKANTVEGGVQSTTSVGIYPHDESPCGARDLAGNVWEWCSTLYQKYPYRLDAKHESLETEGNRVLRGGSWNLDPDYARSAVRDGNLPGFWYNNLGFRVVVASSLKF